MENATYTIGRRDRRSSQPRRGPAARRNKHYGAQIWVNDDTVSNLHAELDVLNGQLYLRDLHSTNGTYVVRNGKREKFFEGYVKPDQVVFFGGCKRTIRQLLEST